MSSTENGEKAKKPEAEPEVKEEEPAEEEEEITVKTKAKKSKKPVEEGFELWNELEIQRVKFMVSALCFKSRRWTVLWIFSYTIQEFFGNCHFCLCRIIFRATFTTYGTWPSSSPLLSISSCSSTRSVHFPSQEPT